MFETEPWVCSGWTLCMLQYLGMLHRSHASTTCQGHAGRQGTEMLPAAVPTLTLG